NLQATAAGAAAWASDLVGADGLRDRMAEEAREQQAEAAEYQPSVGTYKDIEGAGDLAYYLAYGAGTVAPSVIETAALAAAGGGVGGLAVKGGLKMAAKEAAKRGAQIGIAAASIPQAVGEVYNET